MQNLFETPTTNTTQRNNEASLASELQLSQEAKVCRVANEGEEQEELADADLMAIAGGVSVSSNIDLGFEV